MNKIIDAFQFANVAHQGQVRKYSGAPYITHPIRVANEAMLLDLSHICDNVYTVGDDTTVVCACVLHDVIEDTSYNYEHIKLRFTQDIANLVKEVTNDPKVPSENRATRKQKQIAKIAKASRYAKLIKLLDRIDNLTEMYRDIRDENTEIIKNIGFVYKYCDESSLLLEVLRGTYEPLEQKLETIIGRLRNT